MSDKFVIDGNPIMVEEALPAYARGDDAAGRAAMKKFFEEFEKSGLSYCNCPEPCLYHGKCKECVLQHRAGMDHVPYCLRNVINSKLKCLASLTEGSLKDEL